MSSMHLICRILLHFVEFDISNAHSTFSSWENNHHDQFIESVSLFYAFDFKEVECDFKKVAFDFPDVAFDFMQMRNWELTHKHIGKVDSARMRQNNDVGAFPTVWKAPTCECDF